MLELVELELSDLTCLCTLKVTLSLDLRGLCLKFAGNKLVLLNWFRLALALTRLEVCSQNCNRVTLRHLKTRGRRHLFSSGFGRSLHWERVSAPNYKLLLCRCAKFLVPPAKDFRSSLCSLIMCSQGSTWFQGSWFYKGHWHWFRFKSGALKLFPSNRNYATFSTIGSKFWI